MKISISQRVAFTFCCSAISLSAVWPVFAQDTTQDAASVEAPRYAVPVVQLPPLAVEVKLRETGLAQVLRAKFPLAMELRDFGAGWREITFRGEMYFSKSDTVWVNNAEYLVAYKLDRQNENARNATPTLTREERVRETRDFIAQLTRAPRSLPPQARFAITLLRMQSVVNEVVDGQTNLRSFDAARLRADFDPPLELPSYRQNLTLLYLQALKRAVDGFSTRYLNVMPPLDSAFEARQALLPFADDDAIFNVPGTSQPFKTNPILGGKKREHLRRAGRMVLFYEGVPAADGLRAVLQLNGTVRRVDTKMWDKLREASQIS